MDSVELRIRRYDCAKVIFPTRKHSPDQPVNFFLHSKFVVGIAVAAISVAVLYLTAESGIFESSSTHSADAASADISVTEKGIPETDEYGMPVNLYDVTDGRVRRNQTFSDLLAPFDIAYSDVVLLATSAKETFDVRRIRTGKAYRVYLNKQTGLPEYLVYNQDRIRYVVFRLGGATRSVDAAAGDTAALEKVVEIVERPVTTRRRIVSGVITSSLYETLQDLNVNPMLATSLSEVFAWQIDFYRIQRGDRFQIVYDEILIGGEEVDTGNIHAARFNHFGEDYFAFHYADGTIDDFYDVDGQSVRKAFLIAPVSYSRISSGYSGRRYHPVLKRYRSHLGTDYVAPYGTPIHATGDGVVEVAGFASANGNWVKIRHNGTYTTGYLHMSKIARGIRPGKTVKQGDVIGYVGSTGLATGNHVCYRFWKDRVQVDHRRQKLPSVGPIPDNYLTSFEDLRRRYLVELGTFTDLPFAPAYAMLLKESSVLAPAGSDPTGP